MYWFEHQKSPAPSSPNVVAKAVQLDLWMAQLAAQDGRSPAGQPWYYSDEAEQCRQMKIALYQEIRDRKMDSKVVARAIHGAELVPESLSCVLEPGQVLVKAEAEVIVLPVPIEEPPLTIPFKAAA